MLARQVALILLGSGAVACSDAGSKSTAPDLIPSAAPVTSVATIVTPTSGRAVWRAPLGSSATSLGPIEPSLQPIVDICEWRNNACVAAPIAQFSRISGTGGTLLSADVDEFAVDWSIASSALTARKTYRIRVTLNGVDEGSILVDAIRGRWALTQLGRVAPLAVSTFVPIRFWMGQVGKLQLPSLSTIPIGARLVYPQGERPIDPNGDFQFGRDPSDPALLLVDLAASGQLLPLVITNPGPLVITPQEIAVSYAMIHPEIGLFQLADLADLRTTIRSAAKYAAFESLVERIIARGSDLLDDDSAFSYVGEISAELRLRSAAGTRAAMSSPPGTVCPLNQPDPIGTAPIVCRDPLGSWGINNPRPVFLEAVFDGHGASLIEPASFNSLGYFFRTTSPTWTAAISLSPGPHDLLITDGFGQGSAQGTGALWRNGVLVAATAASAIIPIQSPAGCVGKIATTITPAISNAVAQDFVLWRGGPTAFGLARLTTNSFSAVLSCLGLSSTKLYAGWLGSVPKVLKFIAKVNPITRLVYAGPAASELGYLLGALLDPIQANNLALLEDGLGSLTTTGAIWFRANAANAVGSVSGANFTPPGAAMNLPVGPVSFSITAPNFLDLLGGTTTRAGQWVYVDASLSASLPPPTVDVGVGAGTTGTGTVTWDVNRVCSISPTAATGSCSASFAVGALIHFVATPAQGSAFAGWTGSCSGFGLTPTCDLGMNFAGAAYDPKAKFVTVASAIPVLSLPLDGNTFDVSGNGLHGIGTGLVSSADRTTVAFGAYTFNGASSQIVVADDPRLRFASTSAFSVTGWVKLRVANKDQVVLAKYSNQPGSFVYLLSIAANGRPAILVQKQGDVPNAAQSSQAVVPNQWYMMTGTFDGTTQRIYLNGVLVGQQAYTNGAASGDATMPLRIGNQRATDSYWLDGALDDVRIYNVALSQSQVTSLYQTGQP